MIRRPAHTKPRPRARIDDDVKKVETAAEEQPDATGLPKSTSQITLSDDVEPEDELMRIRALLHPPPIPGVDDWGIPPEASEPCDPALEAKLSGFLAMKRDPGDPKHFNDSLMSNRSFRNPHLYTKLVEFVDVDERATNFPQDVWDPNDFPDDWFADRIAEYQKLRLEQQSAAQNSGAKRTQIDFTTPASSSSQRKPINDASRGQRNGGGAPGRSGVLGGGYARGRERTRWG
ncbi:hypothetical protein IEO21_00512 [Rhodonia placenta]|uniref:HCNGP-domain-containing protein n=2 Tax=Rhodonia placenta TaxID=104341 RepID=A0A1X6N8C7_9APHY|nr:hypothetical protein POSPLADRAFT_1178460 [Postia placenta MAD-698-R-SB12]KAF9821666.1 hypothetical protein IEO21_00512 [Postia placenta]OSX64897.1 hypothetical protein POSPLADRAFT_1178460 [Postia placenta MAD-698-R-SB12]